MDISFIIEFNPKQAGEGGGLAPPCSFFCPSTLIFDTIILLYFQNQNLFFSQKVYNIHVWFLSI